MTAPSRSRISERDLQNKFRSDEAGYATRWNELEMACTYDAPAHPDSGQAPGTRSKLLRFRENGHTVMLLHFFLRPDGSLGASGKFDPKLLMVNGVQFTK
jgi:hypothetical protein